jgi:ATP-dependent Lon protease
MIVPLFPLPNMVLFPKTPVPLYIFEERYRIMIKEAVAGNGEVVIGLLRPGSELKRAGISAVHEIACLGRIENCEELEDGKYNIVVVGIQRVRIISEVQHSPYRLVAAAFLPNPGNLPAVNHINADKSNNSVENLEWCDAEYNIAESRRLGLQNDKKVKVLSILTGEVRFYDRIKDAATNLAGKEWAFRILRQKYGDTFFYGEWKVEVMPNIVLLKKLYRIPFPQLKRLWQQKK